MASRIEEGYFLDRNNIARFIDRISEFSVPKIFDEKCNRTLYFNNDEFEVPFTRSVRARRYEKTLSEGQFFIDPKERWFSERKEDTGEATFVKDKYRKVTQLGEKRGG